MSDSPSNATPQITRGDFTPLARSYVHRTGYSLRVLRYLATDLVSEGEDPVADIGAGTGKLTESLIRLGLHGRAIEPNDAMRAEGIRLVGNERGFTWHKGSAESTGLNTASVDWVLMGSTFHWTDQPKALAEIHRILRPGGRLTVLWNPRDIESSMLHMRIEERVRSIIPKVECVVTDNATRSTDVAEVLCSSGHFKDILFAEAPHEAEMTPERYLGAWRSVNEIQAQAGPQRFEEVMSAIAEEIEGLDTVVVPYITRSWTVDRCS